MESEIIFTVLYSAGRVTLAFIIHEWRAPTGASLGNMVIFIAVMPQLLFHIWFKFCWIQAT